REARRETIDGLVTVERPERDADRVEPRLREELHDDVLLLPHPVDDLGRGHPARRGDDDPRRILGPAQDVERQLTQLLEQTSTQRAQARADGRAERAMDGERLAQTDVR